jgi:hypothetical protein
MAQTQYLVTVNDDGTISTSATPVGEGIERQATTFDIYQSSKELVSEIDNSLLADRIASLVAMRLQPIDTTAEIKAKIIDALSDRGIETPQTT